MNLQERRTVRAYTDEPISDQLLNELLELACRASNTGNMQTYSVVVTRSQEMKERLAPTHFNQPMVTKAPVVLTFCADYNRFSAWCRVRNAVPGFDNFQSFVAAMVDATIVAQTFAVAAEAAGLGICYLGTTTYNAQPIIDILGLPELVVPITSLTVGYPSVIPVQPERLPLEAVVHQERYGAFTTGSIETLYAEKEALEVNKNYVMENGKETLAQVFTDIRYTAANNIHFSNLFLEVLKKQGFLN